MKNIIVNREFENTEDGFSLVELMVAILVGAIVLSIAIIALVATNSASLKVLAKSEAQENTRRAVSLIFSEVSDAESLPLCRIATTKTGQEQLQNGDEGNPTGTFSPSNCKETASSGYVVAYASPNRLCYFKTPPSEELASGRSLDIAPEVKCISRGGSDADNNGSLNPKASGSCATTNALDARSEFEVYTYECTGSGNLVEWPTSYGFVTNSTRLISDTGSTTSGPTPPPIFRYYSIDNTEIVPTSLTDAGAFKDIVAVEVNLLTRYDSKSSDGERDYLFTQKIILRGAEQFDEENYDGF